MGFRIQKGKLNSTLGDEITALRNEAAMAEDQVNTMANFSLEHYGLDGDSYRAFRDIVNGRATVAKAHYVFFQRLSAADGLNRSALAQVEEFEDDDSIDTDKCDARIKAAQDEIEALGRECQKAIDSCPLGLGKLAPVANAITAHYTQLIKAQDDIIKANQDAKAKAEAYSKAIDGIYEESTSFANGTLASATSAARARMSDGGYGDMSWSDGLDERYEATKISATLVRQDGSVNEDKVRELYEKGELTDAELKALGIAYSDLMARSMVGDGDPLEAFLNLGYQQTGESWGPAGYGDNATYRATYSALPGFRIAAASWADDSGLPEDLDSDVRNACDATGAEFATTESFTRSCVVGRKGERPKVPLGPNIDISFEEYTPEDGSKPFGLETIAFGDSYGNKNENEAHVTYDSDATSNALNMETYAKEQRIKKPTEEALAAAAKSVFGSLTGLPLDSQDLVGSGLGLIEKYVGKSAIPVAIGKAVADGAFKYYEVTEDNKQFVTIGNVNNIAKNDNDTFRSRGGVLLKGDGTAVQAGSPSELDARRREEAKREYEEYRKGRDGWEDTEDDFSSWLGQETKRGSGVTNRQHVESAVPAPTDR